MQVKQFIVQTLILNNLTYWNSFVKVLDITIIAFDLFIISGVIIKSRHCLYDPTF